MIKSKFLFFRYLSSLILFTGGALCAEQPFQSPSKYVSEELWQDVKEYLIPENDPVKLTLDSIFSKSHVLHDMDSMVAAGFTRAIPQHHTKILVTRHPKLKGYIIKAYNDKQKYHSGKPEYYFWIKRIKGANRTREAIAEHNYGDLLKVPKKWLYLIPEQPEQTSKYPRKNFILVEEDMNLLPAKKNEARWGSKNVDKRLVKALYTIVTEVGLWDCTKPDNCPFSKDGRVAFIDTQVYNSDTIKYHNLEPFLTEELANYWNRLIRNKDAKLTPDPNPYW